MARRQSSKLYTRSNDDISLVYDDPKGRTAVPIALNKPGSKMGVAWDIPGPGHAITFGANRSGKGAGSIIPALLVYFGSCVVIDPKAESLWATFQQRQRLKNRIVVLDPWDEVNKRYGDKAGIRVPVGKFNPLSVLDPKAPEFADDITMLADAVIVPSGSDPYWPDSARELVGGLIAAVVEGDPGFASFSDVRKLLTSSDTELALRVEKIVARNPDSLAARKLRRFIAEDGKALPKDIGSIRSTAITQTAIFDAVTLMSSMETTPDAFNLAELATGRATLYLVLPVDKLFTHGRWLRLMLTLVVRAIVSQPTPPDPPVLMILDELGTITPGTRGGGIPLVAQSAGLVAGLGIRLWTFFQDITQVQRDYPESWETFLANARMIQVLRVNENSTARYFSEYLGTEQVTRFTKNDLDTQTEPLKLPHEIMQMKLGNTLVMFSGGPYFELTQTPYFKEPRFAGRYLQNPNHKIAPITAAAAPSPSSSSSSSVPPINFPQIAANLRGFWHSKPQIIRRLGKWGLGIWIGWFTIVQVMKVLGIRVGW